MTLDARCSLNTSWQIPVPLDQSDSEGEISLSMRTVAGYIAAMHGGNWIITDANQLYLMPLDNEISVLSDEEAAGILFGNTFILV